MKQLSYHLNGNSIFYVHVTVNYFYWWNLKYVHGGAVGYNLIWKIHVSVGIGLICAFFILARFCIFFVVIAYIMSWITSEMNTSDITLNAKYSRWFFKQEAHGP